jgi:N-acetylglutamate synthase-like GNAT family acetyltransferase
LPDTPYVELSSTGEAEFRMLAVDPAAQSRSAGEALVRACLARAVELGCRGVVTCARSISATVHRLYARLRFVRTPERDWLPLPGEICSPCARTCRADLTDQTSLTDRPAVPRSMPSSSS